LQSHFHRPQHLGNERAGAERVARPRSPCAIPLLCSTTVPEFVLSFPFSFVGVRRLEFFFFLSQKLMEMAQGMTQPP